MVQLITVKLGMGFSVSFVLIPQNGQTMINMTVNRQYMKPCSMKMSPFCFSGSHLENGGNRDGQ
jgi:predicted ATP-grasp superfamily ATP-dependent carboligase